MSCVCFDLTFPKNNQKKNFQYDKKKSCFSVLDRSNLVFSFYDGICGV